MLTDKKRRVLLSPEDPAARYELGEALFNEGDLDGAEKQLVRALALDPAHAAARRLLSRTYRAQERPVLAERALAEAVQRDPDDAAAREELSDLLADAGRYDEAILHLEEALRVDGAHRSRRLRVIDLCIVHGLAARAARHIEHARGGAAPDAELSGRMQAVRAQTGQVAGVLRSPLTEGTAAVLARAQRALDRPPWAEAVRAGPLRAALVALRAGDIAGAKRALVTAPEGARATPVFELLRAEIALIGGDRAIAEAALRRALGAAPERAPEAATAWARLGEIALEAGRAGEAEAALAAAAALAPDDAAVLEALGDALHQLGRPDDALGRYEAAMAIRPEVFLSAKIAAVRAPERPAADGAPAAGRIGALAWNPTGGIVSPLQAEAVPGRGELRITGNVHGSGQEAARVAHSLLKARARQLGIEAQVVERDLHLHYADADFRKEGASAGIALTLAALSAYKGRPLPGALAATGQISLDGAVMPVAGLAEKLLAAYLGDVRTVIAPRRCLVTIRTLPREIEGKLSVVFVDSLREAIDAVWGGA
ncbi:ATP-dependent protease [Sorangium cellulosum]|uniref:endopeptidase La n=1 Tax=Sorangium cellulosum TaxID=56 RepID=A0A2L0F4S6_SORCE|nr:S16 family serine protease [Sorangium cellulosum]AUX46439.1 ATP-dependent protease [Sorangium cellulosum]